LETIGLLFATGLFFLLCLFLVTLICAIIISCIYPCIRDGWREARARAREYERVELEQMCNTMKQ
jgi:hypothetical protein